MKLLVLLLVLALRRRDAGWPGVLARPDRHQRCLATLSPVRHGIPGWWLSVALPAILVALLFGWLAGGWGNLLVLVLGTALMLWLVGVESEFRLVDELLVCGRLNDGEALRELAEQALPITGEAGSRDWFRQLESGFLERVFVLFTALFWLMTLGFGAVVLFVLNRAWLQRHREHSDWAQSLDAALRWIPARLTVLALALAGQFGAVTRAAAGKLWRLDDSRELLNDTAQAAEPVEDSAEKSTEEPLAAGMDRLEALHGVLLRALAVWLIFAALWSLLA